MASGLALMAFHSNGQLSLMLDELSKIQCKKDSFYTKGMFPCEISWKNGRKVADDNNSFFTALTFFTLQSVSERLNKENQQAIDEMLSSSDSVFNLYKNRNGGITYNFYAVRPESPFPNVPFLKDRKSSRLPDDLDCSSFIYLVSHSTNENRLALKLAMDEQSSLHPKVKSTIKPFKKSLAYRTWFADKMHQDLDVCVMSNVLLFVLESELPMTSVDTASVAFIEYVVQNDLFVSKPNKISRYYPKTSIILYHISRLISWSSLERIQDLKPKVIQGLRRQLAVCTNEMERVILISSVLKLGEEVEQHVDPIQLRDDLREFYWFDAQPLRGFPVIGGMFAKSNVKRLRYRSDAYNLSLVIEFLALSGEK